MNRKNVLLIAAVTLLLSRPAVSQDLNEIHFFPENDHYGFVQLPSGDASCNHSRYQIVDRTANRLTGDLRYCTNVIESIYPPQLADSNKVSYIAMGEEGDFLVLYDLSGGEKVDTIFKFVRRTNWGSIKHPDTCIYTPGQYVYAAETATLAWSTDVYRPLFEIDRVLGLDSCIVLQHGLAYGIKLTNAFASIQFYRFRLHCPAALMQYDIAKDTTIVLIDPECHSQLLKEVE